MKFFHLSDLHIGLRLLGRDLSEDQAHVLGQVTELAAEYRPDAIVIAGDIYDRSVPSAEAVELLDRFVSGLTEAAPDAHIMMISGNHDSGPRVGCFGSVLARQHVHMIGQPPRREDEHICRIRLEDEWGPVYFDLLPFVRPAMVKEITGTAENGGLLSYDEAIRALLRRDAPPEGARCVLVSHQFYLPAGVKASDVERMDSEIVTVGNVDQVGADVLAPYTYAALGHIHKPMKVGADRYRYCGTPLACSVSEAGQEKGVILVELGEPGTEPVTTVLPLRPLHRIVRIRGTLDEVLRQACGDYAEITLTGDEAFFEPDLQDRIAQAFPNLLQIRRESDRRETLQDLAEDAAALEDPFALCCEFLQDPDEETKLLLRDVLNTVKGGGAE